MSTMPGQAELLVIFFIVGFTVFGVLLTVVPFWRICTKAGFPGALALLMLVPVANIVLPFYLACADWPALRRTGGGPAVTP
jgi:heme/copper-type cytochrome/quinol oxidase subunit 4